MLTLRFDGPPIPAEIVHQEERLPWTKHGPAMLRDLSSGGHAIPDLQLGPTATQARRIECMREVDLVWYDFFIRDGRCCTCFDSGQQEAVALVAGFPGLGAYAGVVRRDGALVVPLARLQAAERVPGPVLFATADEPSNWGVFLLHVVPAVLHYLAHRGSYRALMVHVRHPTMRALLHLLGVRDDELILHDPTRAYRFEEVHVMRRYCHDFTQMPATREAFARLRHRAVADTGMAAGTPLYVGRRRRASDRDNYRVLVNEDRLIERLEAGGFRAIDPEYLGVAEQAALFGTAPRIVGLGGAGLFNVVFTDPGTPLVDIEGSTAFLCAHTHLFANCGLRYGLVLGEEDPSDPTPIQKRWHVDADAAAAAVTEFMEQAG